MLKKRVIADGSNILFIFNDKHQHDSMKGTFSADDLFLDTRYDNIRGAQQFIQDTVLTLNTVLMP